VILQKWLRFEIGINERNYFYFSVIVVFISIVTKINFLSN